MTNYAPQSYNTNPVDGVHGAPGMPQMPYSFFPPFDKESEKIIRDNTSSYDKVMSKVTPLTLAGGFGLWAVLASLTTNRDDYGFAHTLPLAVVMSLWAIMMNARARSVMRFCGIFFALVTLMVATPKEWSIIPLILYVLAFVKGLSPREKKRNFLPANAQDSYQTVWGVAGGHVGANKKFGVAGQLGAEGEAVMGQVLDTFVQHYPFARVFHGLMFTPGVKGADIDHCLLLGNNVVMIDSKNWMIATYEWNRDGAIRDGYPFEGGDVRVWAAQQKWAEYLRETNAALTARIVMVKSESLENHYNVKDRLGNPDYKLETLNVFLNEMEYIASHTEPMVNRQLVTAIKGLMQ